MISAQKLGVLAQLQEARSAAHGAVFGQIAAGLPHEPDGHALGRLAAGGLHEAGYRARRGDGLGTRDRAIGRLRMVWIRHVADYLSSIMIAACGGAVRLCPAALSLATQFRGPGLPPDSRCPVKKQACPRSLPGRPFRLGSEVLALNGLKPEV